MKLQTTIPWYPIGQTQIDYDSSVLLLGSCFVENIVNKLDYFKFQNLHNTFGILFHPLAIEQLISNAIHNKGYIENDIFFHNERWHSFDAHSNLSASSKEKLISRLNEQIKLTNQFLHKATHIIITLGTAWSYRHLNSDFIVSNCHKLPHGEFSKELLSHIQISDSLKSMVKQVRSINKTSTIIFTVSPIRHLKDGFIENSQSKAHLISAIHSILDTQQDKKIHYFPSYELMMDELRDYRFYSEDLIHPNQIAINYIWMKFQEYWISQNATNTMNEIAAIQKDLQHKPFNPNSEAHQKFIETLMDRQSILRSKYPHVTF